MNNTKSICEEFKEQVWLYLETEADAQMKNFWNKHLAGCADCSNHLKVTRKFLGAYNSIPGEDISEIKFDKMINLVTNRSRFSLKQKTATAFEWLKHEFTFAGNYKIAFGSTLIVLIFALILFFKEYKPKIEIKQKQTTGEVKAENQVDKTESTPTAIEAKTVKKVGGVSVAPRTYRASIDDHWDIDIQTISIQIDLLKKQTDELEF
ncbi:MAG: hypothetical protein C4539_05890 [Ignavibacteriales bacterium]|nr:MAG: hypothetical protein C4539_05890 [Ignavibacteriales bacterium]